jgi:hypothetical protein
MLGSWKGMDRNILASPYPSDYATGQLTYHMLHYGAGFSRNDLSPKTPFISPMVHAIFRRYAGQVFFSLLFGYSAVAREPPQDVFALVSTQFSAGRKLANKLTGYHFCL